MEAMLGLQAEGRGADLQRLGRVQMEFLKNKEQLGGRGLRWLSEGNQKQHFPKQGKLPRQLCFLKALLSLGGWLFFQIQWAGVQGPGKQG